MSTAVSVVVLGIIGFLSGAKGLDEIAQATCTALLPTADYVSAVKRVCTSTCPSTCASVCSEKGKICFNALHLYSTTRSYKYDSCSNTGCGPNYCCCSDKTALSSQAYKDEIAQATCTAVLGSTDYVSAVKRQCSSSTPACDTVCRNLGKTCIESLHVYDKILLGPANTGNVSLSTYKYKACTNGGCGPNFCCCSGK